MSSHRKLKKYPREVQCNPDSQSVRPFRVLSAGVLSNTPGSFFLLRHDQYMVIVELLESSFLYNLVLMKGLELQMTSCHTVEANRLHLLVLSYPRLCFWSCVFSSSAS